MVFQTIFLVTPLLLFILFYIFSLTKRFINNVDVIKKNFPLEA